MYEITIDNMDLAQIAASGQCFTWKRVGEAEKTTYGFVALDRYLEITQQGNRFTLSCDSKEWENVWCNYFDFDTDYKDVANRILTSGDEYLINAYRQCGGVRILRQDLWEMIVTFMISQNNNIKRITKSVDMLVERCGCKCEDGIHYRFPRPGEAPEEVFADAGLGFGYRAEYLREIFEYAAGNPGWLDSLKRMTYDEAFNELLKRKGIGAKVANCICLFGLHHIDAFPIDTHIKQILSAHYPDGFDFERYKGVAGIVQQYMFYAKIN